MATKRTPGIKSATPAGPDYDYIADSGDLAAYRAAWDAFPDERDTLEDLFPDLHNHDADNADEFEDEE